MTWGAAKSSGTANLCVYQATRGRVDNGADEMRLIVRNIGNCRQSFVDQFTAEQLLQLFRMQLASGWDFYPDQWEARQVSEALQGVAPAWDNDETPLYPGMRPTLPIQGRCTCGAGAACVLHDAVRPETGGDGCQCGSFRREHLSVEPFPLADRCKGFRLRLSECCNAALIQGTCNDPRCPTPNCSAPELRCEKCGMSHAID